MNNKFNCYLVSRRVAFINTLSVVLSIIFVPLNLWDNKQKNEKNKIDINWKLGEVAAIPPPIC
jgi:hypothetical protein